MLILHPGGPLWGRYLPFADQCPKLSTEVLCRLAAVGGVSDRPISCATLESKDGANPAATLASGGRVSKDREAAGVSFQVSPKSLGDSSV
jgi:hypothetical protein